MNTILKICVASFLIVVCLCAFGLYRYGQIHQRYDVVLQNDSRYSIQFAFVSYCDRIAEQSWNTTELGPLESTRRKLGYRRRENSGVIVVVDRKTLLLEYEDIAWKFKGDQSELRIRYPGDFRLAKTLAPGP